MKSDIDQSNVALNMCSIRDKFRKCHCFEDMDYPKSHVPTDPVLSPRDFGPDSAPHVPSVLDIAHVRHVTSGRMAIALALEQMGVKAGDEVLMPAYHSRSMVEPVVWMGAKPVFCRVTESTALDLEDVAGKITARSKVLVVVNYFGFPQDLPRVRDFCDAHGLAMLEDCAHAFQGAHAGKPLGSFGDYAIASTMKFFPVYDGGCLLSARHRLDGLALQSAGLRFEAKTAFNTMEKSFSFGRMQPLARVMSLPLRIKDRVWGRVKAQAAAAPGADAGPIGPRASDGAFGFEAAWRDKRASMMSRLVLGAAARNRAGATRRAHYATLQAAFANLPGCRPLYPALPEAVYPWVFPLKVDDPATVFPALKFAGVPVIRFGEFLWDDVDATVCAASVDLSRQVMQFPVHQALTDAELDWMIGSVRRILLSGAPMRTAA